MAKKALSLKKDARHTLLSTKKINESLKKQTALVENHRKKPLLFFRKYVAVRGRITQKDFARVSYISEATVKRYTSSTKQLPAASRTRMAYGLMLYWPQLEEYAYQDVIDEMQKKYYDKQMYIPTSKEEIKFLAKQRLWKEYHAAFHEDAEMAKALAGDKDDLVRILYNYRYPKK